MQRRRWLGGARACKTVTIQASSCFVRFVSLLSFRLCKGDPYPEKGAQRRLGAEDFFVDRTQGRRPVSFGKSTYLFGVRDIKRE
jgi:hypothetical protein